MATINNRDLVSLVGAFGSGSKAIQWLDEFADWKTQLDPLSAFTEFFVPERAIKVVDSLTSQAQAILALLCDAGGTLVESVLFLEAERLLGREGLARGLDDMARRRLFFTITLRPGDPRGKVYSLPEALHKWLSPELSGLINASSARVAHDDDDSMPAQYEAPLVSALSVLCTVAQLRPRITERRLYKKDAEKIVELFGFRFPSQADAAVSACFSLGMLKGSYIDGVGRALPRWDGARKFVTLSPYDRAERSLATYSGGPIVSSVFAARGGWINSVQLARESRVSFAVSNSMSLPKDQAALMRLLDDHWRADRKALISHENLEHSTVGGEECFRLRPEFAAGFRGRFTDPAPVFVQPNFEVIVPKEVAPEALLLFAQSCELVRSDTVMTFVFTQESVQRAALEGLSAADITQGAARFSAHGVPDNVIRSINDWASSSGRVTVESLCLIEVDDSALIERVVASLGKLARQVGPKALVASNKDAKAVTAALEKHGLKPRTVSPGEGEDRVSDMLEDGLPPGAFPPPLGLALPPARIEKMRQAFARESQPVTVVAAKPSISRPGREPPTATDPQGIFVLFRKAQELDCEILFELDRRVNPMAVGRVIDIAGDGKGAPTTFRIINTQTKGSHWYELSLMKQATLDLRTARRIGRNALCPCGSDFKYKRCCGSAGTV
jgi:hypothetical protein